MNIARHVITKIGSGDFRAGVPIVSKILEIHPTRVYRMTYPKEKGGTGGLIKAEHQLVLIQEAQNYGVKLLHSDFFPPDTNKAA